MKRTFAILVLILVSWTLARSQPNWQYVIESRSARAHSAFQITNLGDSLLAVNYKTREFDCYGSAGRVQFFTLDGTPIHKDILYSELIYPMEDGFLNLSFSPPLDVACSGNVMVEHYNANFEKVDSFEFFDECFDFNYFHDIYNVLQEENNFIASTSDYIMDFSLDGLAKTYLPLNQNRNRTNILQYPIEEDSIQYVYAEGSALFVLDSNDINASEIIPFAMVNDSILSLFNRDSHIIGITSQYVLILDEDFNPIDTLRFNGSGIHAYMDNQNFTVLSEDSSQLIISQFQGDSLSAEYQFKKSFYPVSIIQIEDEFFVSGMTYGGQPIIQNFHPSSSNLDITPDIELLDVNMNIFSIDSVANQDGSQSPSYYKFRPIFSVKNNSTDTISHMRYWADLNFGLFCPFDVYEVFDSLILLPGQEVEVISQQDWIGPYQDSISICFSILAPNYLPDGDFGNNEFCISQELIVGVERQKRKSGSIKVYPNPSLSGFFNLDIGNAEIEVLRVFDSNGKLFQIDRDLGRGIVELNLSQMQTGIYFLQINAGNNIYFNKLILQ